MKQITVNAETAQVKIATSFVNEHLAALGCSERIRIQVDVAVDEIFSNIANYAYRPDTGPVTVQVGVEEDPLSVIITFIDHGVPFDPLSREQSDPTDVPKTERTIGGLGLYMVKKIMDDISYSYEDGRNVLTIRKKI